MRGYFGRLARIRNSSSLSGLPKAPDFAAMPIGGRFRYAFGEDDDDDDDADDDDKGGGGGKDDDEDDDKDKDADKAAKAERQKAIDSAVAKEKRGWQKKVTSLQGTITKLEEKDELTKKEKAKLAAKRDELEEELSSSEEREAAAVKKQKSAHDKALTDANARADTNWTRYEDREKQLAISDAAIDCGAVSADQIRDHVLPRAKFVEDVDDEGKGLGTYTTRVDLTTKKEDGTKETKSVLVAEYVEHMRTQDTHKNLFGSSRVGGTHHRPGTQRGGARGGPDTRTSKEKIRDGLNARKAGKA